MATVLAGILLVVMGLTGTGALMRFVPYPVTVGFTSGIALVIFSLQIRDFMGLPVGTLPDGFVPKWQSYFSHLHAANVAACAPALCTLVLLVFWPRITSRIPGLLVALVLGTSVAQLFHLPVETVGTRFGEIPRTLPSPRLTIPEWSTITSLVSPAVTIALLGAIESLLSAVVADGMLGTRHRPNVELVAQGVGNILSPIFSGIPATGAIARTAANVKAGGRTPVAGIIHALTLLLIMLFFAPSAALIPLPVLAAILVFVAYNMSEWRTFVRIARGPRSDMAVLVTTFLLTVLVDLTVAIEVGVVLAAFLFLRKMEGVVRVGEMSYRLAEDETGNDEPQEQAVPEGVQVFEIYGPLFFGAVERFNRAIERIEARPKVLILRMDHVAAIDVSGIHALEGLMKRTTRNGTALLLASVQPKPLEELQRAGFLAQLKGENVLKSTDEAIQRAREIVEARA